MLGYKHTDEARANMSKAQKGLALGRVASSETRAKISAARLGHEVTPETRAKIAEAHIGMESPLKGIPRTDEVKAKISESNTGHGFTDESRAKISASLLQYHQDVRDGKIEPKPRKQRGSNSPEQNAAIGDALRGRKRPQYVIDAMWAGRDRYIAEQKAIKDAQTPLEGLNGDPDFDGEATEATG